MTSWSVLTERDTGKGLKQSAILMYALTPVRQVRIRPAPALSRLLIQSENAWDFFDRGHARHGLERRPMDAIAEIEALCFF